LSGLPADSSTVDTQVEVLKSRHLADRVVEVLKLEQDPEFNAALRPAGPMKAILGGIGGLFHAAAPVQLDPSPAAVQRRHEAVVDALLTRLKVSRSGLTYVINVAFTSTSPAKAAQIA